MIREMVPADETKGEGAAGEGAAHDAAERQTRAAHRSRGTRGMQDAGWGGDEAGALIRLPALPDGEDKIFSPAGIVAAQNFLSAAYARIITKG